MNGVQGKGNDHRTLGEQCHQHSQFTIPSKQLVAEVSWGGMNSAQAYAAFDLVDQANYSPKEHPCGYSLPLTDNGCRHCTHAREDTTERHAVDMFGKETMHPSYFQRRIQA